MTGQVMVIAGLSLAALVFAGILRRRAGAQNRRLSTALDNMSQGQCMFDAQSCILVVNRCYIEMYGPSPQVVRPGISLKQLIQYRKNTGLFAGDVDAYCQRIRDSMRAEAGASKGSYIPASNGRIVLAKNEPLANGGWVSTHEDVTAQRSRARDDTRAGAAPRGHRHQYSLVPAAGGNIALERERQRCRHALDRRRAVFLLRPDHAARDQRGAGVHRGFHLSHSIAEISS
jgi:hypothetical protein